MDLKSKSVPASFVSAFVEASFEWVILQLFKIKCL